MLSSAEVAEPPTNDEEIVAEYNGQSPKEIDWEFEDNKC